MDIVVAGGHGQIALKLLERLAADGHRARGLIRNPDQVSDLESIGAEAVVCDMEAEEDLAPFTEGADAVVFAAGAGPGSGPERKRTVDLGAAVKLIDAARSAGARYVMLSAIGVDTRADEPGPMQAYIQAKAEADAAVRTSGVPFAIVRPGTLTDDEPTGLVEAREGIEPGGQISRSDVAAVIAEVLESGGADDRSFDLVSGETPISEAVAAL